MCGTDAAGRGCGEVAVMMMTLGSVEKGSSGWKRGGMRSGGGAGEGRPMGAGGQLRVHFWRALWKGSWSAGLVNSQQRGGRAALCTGAIATRCMRTCRPSSDQTSLPSGKGFSTNVWLRNNIIRKFNRVYGFALVRPTRGSTCSFRPRTSSDYKCNR